MNSYVVVTFYLFVPLENYISMRDTLLTVMKNNHVKGTIILANEGINGTFCGKREEIAPLISQIHSYPELANLNFRETYSEFNPFAKAKVKLRKEIVTIGISHVDAQNMTGVSLEPQEWNELIADPEVFTIDTRNGYEIELGTFKHAINPHTENFRDFPDYVEKNLLDKKDKKIAMFCTGGVRCEKSTAYLRSLGFKEVYQLKGGILNYLEKMPENDSLWEGGCFVFDDRVALDRHLNGFKKGSIDTEWKNNHRKKQTEVS